MHPSDRRKSLTARDVIELTKARRLLRNGQAQRIRVDAGLSQIEIARSIGVSAGTVSRWESGDRRPVGDAALAYARVLLSLCEASDK